MENKPVAHTQQALAAIFLITLLPQCRAIGIRSRFGTVLPELLDNLNDWLVNNLKRQPPIFTLFLPLLSLLSVRLLLYGCSARKSDPRNPLKQPSFAIFYIAACALPIRAGAIFLI
jgi:hypothetical protein